MPFFVPRGRASLVLVLIGGLAAAGCTSPRKGSHGDAGASSTDDAGAGHDADSAEATDAAAPSECVVARCEDGHAATCDHGVALDCSSFAAACVPVMSEAGAMFSWCSCGALGEGRGRCLGTHEAVVCQAGAANPATCGPGTRCAVSTSAPSGIECACDNLSDGLCPDPSCTGDADCHGCTPSCGGHTCGDNGCGGSCGSCSMSERCAEGRCVPACTPSCAGRSCGSDGCGGSCGSCSGTQTCNTSSGRCESSCTRSCAGRTCGSDGCGGSCGSCSSGRECNAAGNACVCDFFSTVSYTLDASAVDFSRLFSVVVTVRHIALDGARSDPHSELLTTGMTRATYSAFGCEPHLEVRRMYSVRGSSASCTFTDEVRTANIAIPNAVIGESGDGCTAPAL